MFKHKETFVRIRELINDNPEFYFLLNINRKKLHKLINKSKLIVRWADYLFEPEMKDRMLQLTQERDFDSSFWYDNIDVDGRIVGQLPVDGNIFDHSVHLFEIVEKFGKLDHKAGLVSDEEYFQLLILALIHEAGEVFTGDYCKHEDGTYNYPNLTLEEVGGRDLIKFLFSDDKGESLISTMDLNKLLDIYKINHDKSHYLHSLFKVYEKISYMNGALLAYENRSKIKGADALIHNVLKNQIGFFIENEDKYPCIKYYLKFKNGRIDRLFDYVDTTGYSNVEHPEYNNEFVATKKQWFAIVFSMLTMTCGLVLPINYLVS